MIQAIVGSTSIGNEIKKDDDTDEDEEENVKLTLLLLLLCLFVALPLLRDPISGGRGKGFDGSQNCEITHAILGSRDGSFCCQIDSTFCNNSMM